MNNNKKNLSMKWFNIYINVMIVFCILNALSLSLYINYFSNNIYSPIILFLFAIDFIYTLYQFIVYYNIRNQKYNSINQLVIILCINFILKSFSLTQRLSGNFTGNFILCLGIYSIYYIPNIIYFAKRRNVFNDVTQKANNMQQETYVTNSESVQEVIKYEDAINNTTLNKLDSKIYTKIFARKKFKKRKTQKHKSNYKLLIFILTFLLFVILLSVGAYFTMNYMNSLKNQIKNYQNLYADIKTKYETLREEYVDKELKYQTKDEKINFYDKNIVFVLDGYGNYYYTYDQMKQVTQGKSYSYFAYNKEAAIANGYIAFQSSSLGSFKEYLNKKNTQ